MFDSVSLEVLIFTILTSVLFFLILFNCIKVFCEEYKKNTLLNDSDD